MEHLFDVILNIVKMYKYLDIIYIRSNLQKGVYS